MFHPNDWLPMIERHDLGGSLSLNDKTDGGKSRPAPPTG